MVTDISTTLATQAVKDLSRESRRIEGNLAVAPQQGGSQVTPIRPAQATSLPQAVQPTSSMPKEEVQVAVTQMKDFAQMMNRQLQFDVDDDSGRTVVRVLDKDSGNVIRQIPSDEILALARQMKEMMESESAKVAGKGMRDQPVGLLMKTEA